MSQYELERDLSRATGESARRIRRMGFTLMVMPDRTARKAVRKSITDLTSRVGHTQGVAGHRD